MLFERTEPLLDVHPGGSIQPSPFFQFVSLPPQPLDDEGLVLKGLPRRVAMNHGLSETSTSREQLLGELIGLCLRLSCLPLEPLRRGSKLCFAHRLIASGGYSHGWLGNPTDEKRAFEAGLARQFLSVGLPSHPWD